MCYCRLLSVLIVTLTMIPIPKYLRKTLRIPLKSLGITPDDKVAINKAVSDNNHIYNYSLLFIQYLLVRNPNLFDTCVTGINEAGEVIIDNVLITWIIKRIITFVTNRPQYNINYTNQPKKMELINVIMNNYDRFKQLSVNNSVIHPSPNAISYMAITIIANFNATIHKLYHRQVAKVIDLVFDFPSRRRNISDSNESTATKTVKKNDLKRRKRNS